MRENEWLVTTDEARMSIAGIRTARLTLFCRLAGQKATASEATIATIPAIAKFAPSMLPTEMFVEFPRTSELTTRKATWHSASPTPLQRMNFHAGRVNSSGRKLSFDATNDKKITPPARIVWQQSVAARSSTTRKP